jgi:Arc/MetJ-type ribon-helix-helix transcriptional regulator
MDDASKFQKLVQFRVPEALSDAIDSTATKHFQTKSEYIRRSVIESLRNDGVRFDEIQVA